MKTAAIGDCEYRCIGIGVGIGRLKISWIDPNVVTPKTFDRLTTRCHGPFFYVRGQPISILQNKIRSVRFMALFGEFRGTNQTGNHRGECRR